MLAGETVEIEGFVAAHPEWAGSLRQVLPTMQRLTALNRAVGVDGDLAATGSRDAQGRKVFGEFRIVREIARGGMGVVYEAEQVPLGRMVALKVLPLAATLDPRALQRFQLEAQVAGLLQHPRIVPVHAVGMVDDVPYYAMQYIEGGSLAELIAALRCFNAGSALNSIRSLEAQEGEAPSEPRVSAGPVGASPSLNAPVQASGLGNLAAELLAGRYRPGAKPAEGAGSLSPPEARRSIRNRSYIARSPAWASRRPRRSRMRTTRGSCTATSSRPTSS